MAGRSVPFDMDGNMLIQTNVKPGSVGEGVDWKPNVDFESTMTVTRITRTKSTARIVLLDENNKAYTMFLKEFMNLCRLATIDKGKVHGIWAFRTWGKYYSLMYLRNAEVAS